jgi:predicted NAD/FAD-binding protein
LHLPESLTLFYLEYMAVGLFQESYVVACGVQQVVQNISAPLKHIHLETQVNTIQPNKDSKYKFELIDEHGVKYDVDHIIFATQGNQAISMLKAYTAALKQSESYEDYKQVEIVHAQMDMLKKFHYDTSLVINHTDTRLLPSDPANWKALNLAMVDESVDPGESDLIVSFPHDTTMTTHILNLTHHNLTSKTGLYMQTTNPCIAVDPKKVLSVSWFERATVTLESKKALEDCLFVPGGEEEIELGPCQGKNGIWFVGSYCWKGIPLLEGCVASAELVVTKGIARKENINIQLPY